MSADETNINDEGAYGNDRQEIIRMLRELIRTLDLIIYQRAAPIPGELQDPLRAAWDDFHERHRGRLFDQLGTAPETDNDLSETDRARGRMSLAGAGLTGPHLRVKSVLFWGATKRYILRRGLKELHDILSCGDIWLESLKEVLQISEILIELKKVVEKAIEMLDRE